jgi:beta-glucuronidase
MSETRPSNFDPGIHVVHYADEFRAQRLDHRTLINDFGRQREPLDGEWSFAVDQYDSFLRLRWFEEREKDPEGRPLPRDYNFEAWEQMPVPSCWNMRKSEYLLYEGTAVYTRTFPYARALGRDARRSRVFLKVGAANYECFVFLNKRCLGSHLGGSTPFFVEVTPHLLPDNRISLVVNNRRESFHVPADNTDWFNYGGLYRSVELIYVPETFIKTYQVSLVPGGRFGALRAMVDLDGSDAEGEATLRIPELAVETRFAVSKGLGACELEAYPKLWSPESPKLYNVEISYSGGSVTDVVRDRVGFREIATRGTSLLLNGKPIYLRGVSCHEDSVENGKAVSPSEIRGMLETARELGCNFLRLAHYPHAEEAARMADELGMLLWEEIPVYWAIDFANPETFADAYNQLSELVLRDRNRASVILWSVGNENPDSDERLSFMSRLASRARELDPTRLVTAACLWDTRNMRIADRLAEHLDVPGINEYYGWYVMGFDRLERFFRGSAPGKPVIVSEFGADALAGHIGEKNELFGENYQLHVYREQIRVISKADYVVGMTPWILFDFRCPRRTNAFQRGYNRKGLVAADRGQRKLAFTVLQEYYRERAEKD